MVLTGASESGTLVVASSFEEVKFDAAVSLDFVSDSKRLFFTFLVMGWAADALVQEAVDALESDACFLQALDARTSYVEGSVGSREIHDDGTSVSSNVRIHELGIREPDDPSFAPFLAFFFGLIALGSLLSVCFDFDFFSGDALSGDLSEAAEASDLRFGVRGDSVSHSGDAFTDFGLLTFLDLGFDGDFDGVSGVFGSFALLRVALGLVFLVSSL